MIEVLKSKSKNEAQLILAKASEMLLISPEADSRKEHAHITNDLSEKILNEVKRKLQISDEDFSDKAKAKIYRFLANEMAQLVLPSQEISKAKNRVGQKGALRPDLYTVNFQDTFTQYSKVYLTKKPDVVTTVNNPDYYDHLFPESDKGYGFNPFSLYIKSFGVKKNAYYLLVLAERIGATQKVYNAWMVFLSDIKIKYVNSALDILKAFVDTYGLEFETGGERCKLLIQKTVPLTNFQIKINQPTGEGSETHFIGRNYADKQESLVGIGFSLDASKYRDDLRQHGIRIEKNARVQ